MSDAAAGEKLASTQEDVQLNGWSVESRVYAEDPYRGFLPSTGRLVRYHPPSPSGEGLGGGPVEQGRVFGDKPHPNPASGETALGSFRSLRGSDRPEAPEGEG